MRQFRFCEFASLQVYSILNLHRNNMESIPIRSLIMAALMQAYYACRLEGQHNPARWVDQHRCLVQGITKTTMVVRLDYSEWNRDAPSSTSINGVLVRCYFNPREPHSNYIIAYGSTKSASKRAIFCFLERYPLCTFEPSTTPAPTPKVPVSVSPYTTTMVTS